MRRPAAALLLSLSLALLAGCDMLKGFLGLGYTVEGRIAFSANARTVDGDVVVRLLSTVDAARGGTVVSEEVRPYQWEESSAFTLQGIPAGSYHLLVFIDANASGAWEPGEPVGGYPLDSAGNPVTGPFEGDAEVCIAVWKNGPPAIGTQVSVVYNDADPDDRALACDIRTVLTTNLPVVLPGVGGVMPRFTVTLVPQCEVPLDWSLPYTVRGGADVVVLTPGITLHYDPEWCGNIVDNELAGIIAMGSGGSWFLGSVAPLYAGWGHTDQAPDEIGCGSSMTESSDSIMTAGVEHWREPLVSSSIPPGSGQPVRISAGARQLVVACKPGGLPPVLGEWIAASALAPDRFAVGLQGRFLLCGFSDILECRDTAGVLFTNLVAMMADGS